MRFLPAKIHGYLDYLVSVLLMAAPWLFNFDRGGAETWLPVVLGVGAILYSLFTDYEMGASRQFSMRTHLAFDMLSGVFLALSPWIFGFHDYVYTPHVAFGILEIGVALVTQLHPSNEKQEHRNSCRGTGSAV